MDKLNSPLSKIGQNKKRLAALAVITTAALSQANAAGTTIEVTDVVTTITNGVITVSSIGVAVLSLVVVIKVFKWARSAM